MMRAALSPNFPLPQWPRRVRAAARPNNTTLLNYINYVLGYYNYSLIISSYHNDARSPSAKISRHHNDPGTRTQLRFLFN